MYYTNAPHPHPKLHTSELNDGYDWGRLNLQSVTEQSSLDDFLATAELAGTEFTAGSPLFSPPFSRRLGKVWCLTNVS